MYPLSAQERAFAVRLAHDCADQSPRTVSVSVVEDAALAELVRAAKEYPNDGTVFCVWARERVERACEEAVEHAEEVQMKPLQFEDWLELAFPREAWSEDEEEAVAA